MKWLILAAAIAMNLGTLAHAGSGHHPSHGDLETQLELSGMRTDSLSLLESATSSGVDRWGAIELLGRRKVEGAQEALLEILEVEPVRFYRRTAALALARLGDERGIAALRELYGSGTDLKDRLFIASRLVEFGDLLGRDAIREANASERSLLRRLSVESTAWLLGYQSVRPEAMRVLEKLSLDPDPKVRAQVPLQLTLSRYRGEPVEGHTALVQRMAQEDQDPDVQSFAAATLLHWSQLEGNAR